MSEHPLPQPLPTGTDMYYRERVTDFARRHPNAQPPSYYLELDDQAFHDFAFSTHADAYVEAGVFDLPAQNLWRILKTPDMTEVVSPDGIGEILELLGKLDRDDLAQIVDATVMQVRSR